MHKEALERDAEELLRAEVMALGGECLKWVSPGTRGPMDRIVILRGRVRFVELKKGRSGKVSKLQSHMAERLLRVGAEVVRVWGVAGVRRFVDELKKC